MPFPLFFPLAFLIFTVNCHNPTIRIDIRDRDSEATDLISSIITNSIRNGSLKATVHQILCDDCATEIAISGKDLQNVRIESTIGSEKWNGKETFLRSVQKWSQQYFAQFEDFHKISNGWHHLASQVVSPLLLDGAELEAPFEENSGNMFVLYFKPGGKLTNLIAFLSFDLASKELEEVKLVAVNCEESGEFCEEQKVSEFPSLWCYKDRTLYSEMDDEQFLQMDIQKMKDWIRGLLQPALRMIGEEEVPYFRSGIVPGFGEQRSSVHMLFIDSKKRKVYKEFHRIAKELHGQSTMVAVVNEEISKWAHNPAIITMKPLEPLTHAYTLYKDMSLETMREYVRTAEEPSVFDLRDPSQVLTAFSSELPLLIHFDVEGTPPPDEFLQIASDPELEFRSSTARFASVSGVNPFSLSLLGLLNVHDLSPPAYILVDFKKNVRHIRPIRDGSSVNLREFIEIPSGEDNPTDISFDLSSIRNIFFGALLEDFIVAYALPTPISEPHHEEL